MSGPLILAVETSCDETAVAILAAPGELLASEIASQVNLHQRFGGVVPEVASRNHLIKIEPLIRGAFEHAGCLLSDLDCIAATRGPGLLTSLLVGYNAAKGEHLLSTRARVYIRTGPFWRRHYWHCPT